MAVLALEMALALSEPFALSSLSKTDSACSNCCSFPLLWKTKRARFARLTAASTDEEISLRELLLKVVEAGVD